MGPMWMGGAVLAFLWGAVASEPDAPSLRVCSTDRLETGIPFTRRPDPEVPPGAQDGTTCRMTWTVDDDGVPSVSTDAACPPAAAEAWRASLGAWRYRTPRVGDWRDGAVTLRVQSDPCPMVTFRSLGGGRPRGVPDVVGDTHCRIRLTIEADEGPGRVTELEPVGPCPSAFLEDARALSSWTFHVAGTDQPYTMTHALRWVDGTPHWGPLPAPIAILSSEDGDPVELRTIPVLPWVGRRPKGSPSTCDVSVRIDPGGHPTAVSAPSCPARLQDTLAHNAMRWRFSAPASGASEVVLVPLRLGDEVEVIERAPGRSGDPIQIVHRVAPKLPPQASAWRGETITCTVSVTLSERGHPRLIAVEGCPPLFADAVDKAVRRWRWSGPDLDGRTLRLPLSLHP